MRCIKGTATAAGVETVEQDEAGHIVGAALRVALLAMDARGFLESLRATGHRSTQHGQSAAEQAAGWTDGAATDELRYAAAGRALQVAVGLWQCYEKKGTDRRRRFLLI